jgi:hypothetical protein
MRHGVTPDRDDKSSWQMVMDGVEFDGGARLPRHRHRSCCTNMHLMRAGGHPSRPYPGSGFSFVIDNARSFRICVTNFNATKNCILPVIICDAVMACARHEFVREWDRPASADPAVNFDQDRSTQEF